MKRFKAALIFVVMMSVNAHAEEFSDEPMCKVEVCNKIERFSLSIMSHVKDSMGKTCTTTYLPKSEAIVGHELSSESRWYQGSSINPTKKSVTRVAEVYKCQGEK